MPVTSICTRSPRKRNKTTTARAPPQRGAYAKGTHAASSAERTGAAPGPADLQRQTPLALTQRTKRTRPAHQTRARLSGKSRCGVVRIQIFPRVSRGRKISSPGTPPVKASLCVLLAFFTSPPGVARAAETETRPVGAVHSLRVNSRARQQILMSIDGRVHRLGWRIPEEVK